MRNKFDQQLSLLNQELISMGALCESSIALAARMLAEGDRELSLQVRSYEGEIDEKERVIESMCLKLLLHQQPVARDLRSISAALKMITDMERIGDQAADISEIIGYMEPGCTVHDQCVSDMAAATIKMVTDSVDAFVKRDVSLAEAVICYDDVVDALFEQMKKSLIGMIASQPEQGESALDLLMISKYFERIGDHAVNIAEWVIFSVTGVHKGEIEL